jgi:type IV secretory pathway VirB10-like protein
MTEPSNGPSGETPVTATPGAIHDRRVAPRGVLPRHVQTWLMVGIAVVLLAIILFTGQSQPLPRPSSSPRPASPTLVPPERVRSYEQQLDADLARDRQAALSALAPAATAPGAPRSSGEDPTTDDLRQREAQSLFADNVALSRRAPDRQPFGERRSQDPTPPPAPADSSPDLALLQQLLNRSPLAAAGAPRPAVVPPSAPTGAPGTSTSADAPQGGGAGDIAAPPRDTAPTLAGGSVSRLLEGTVIETVLLTRLDGTFAGPVHCLVTTPVYAHDRQSVLIPAGARALGAASPVQTWGESRLAIAFHRLVMPDGRTHSLDRFKGLDQVGSTGLKDSVNHHYLQVFGASLAIGALSGLAQYGSRSSIDAASASETYRQGVGSSLAASTGRVLDRYLNVLPTITIREGYRIKVYLTNDLSLPPYAAVSSGGAR